jgi:hypothetical protein
MESKIPSVRREFLENMAEVGSPLKKRYTRSRFIVVNESNVVTN